MARDITEQFRFSLLLSHSGVVLRGPLLTKHQKGSTFTAVINLGGKCFVLVIVGLKSFETISRG